jgi:hypothetical protein
MTWSVVETNTHQDHVIAHVIGATPLGHFCWDETAYVLLDIGFIWNIYLNMEMGLLPHPVKIADLEAEDAIKAELRADIDRLLQGGQELTRMKRVDDSSPILSVELLESGNARQLIIVCEEQNVIVETSLTNGSVIIHQPKENG